MFPVFMVVFEKRVKQSECIIGCPPNIAGWLAKNQVVFRKLDTGIQARMLRFFEVFDDHRDSGTSTQTTVLSSP